MGFFALGECRHLASKAIGGCDGPPQSPAFLLCSISPIRGFSSLRRGAKLFMAALLKAQGCAAALSMLALLPLPAADPRPAATGPAPSAHGVVGTAGGTGGHWGAEPVPCGGRSPPVVPTAAGSKLPAGSLRASWLLPVGLRSLSHQMCPAVQVRSCACLVWQPKPTRGSGLAVPVAAHRWNRHACSATKPPSAGQPLCLLPRAGMEWGGHGSLGGSPPSPAPSWPRRTQSSAARLLWPWEHRSSCWHGARGTVPPSLQMVKGGGEKCCLLYHLMTLLLMEGAAEQLAGFLELPLGKASRLFPAQHRRGMLPPETSRALHPYSGCPAVALWPCSGHALPLGEPGEDGPHLPSCPRGVPMSHCQTHEQAKMWCRASDACPAQRDPCTAGRAAL